MFDNAQTFRVSHYKPTRLEIDDLDFHNHLCRFGKINLGTLNGKPVSFRTDPTGADSIDVSLGIQIGDADGVLGLSQHFIDTVMAERTDQIQTQDRCFLANLIFDDLLAPLEQKLGSPITFTSIVLPLKPSVRFTLTYGNDVYGVSFAGSDTINTLLGQCTPKTTDIGETPITASLQIGRINLPIQTVKTLARGDVIIPHGHPIKPGLATLHLHPNLVADATFNHRTATLKEDFKMALDTTTAEVSLCNIDIELTFELCRQTVPLHKIETLGKGHIFRFDSRIDDSFVRILANGRQIATGELVQIGDKLGVQLRDRIND
ncbi:FliM/FliN family flagellar motor switch protein [Parasulfitobacter algicola]|uniref:FliM/FliN family flagellar motor switch protein n=1 Tax=Parasulfitobacter algicola TaxID=2614809 RepID=A0ABX2IV22_9RHOB|nr:FliM/FliN family flagellar motor switch protein [Sulfitobacter algicola]NSX56759.1 FliM/FliN family flagellar motor switch protein [Sulfitobacter algicola]